MLWGLLAQVSPILALPSDSRGQTAQRLHSQPDRQARAGLRSAFQHRVKHEHGDQRYERHVHGLHAHPHGETIRAEDYHRRFTERFGTATLVPLLDVISPGIGLGYPAGYPTSVLPLPPERDAGRHAHLAQLITGESEVTLTDELIDTMTGSLFDPRLVPSHVEIAARVQAASTADLDAGRYTQHISPARAAGTLTSRFSTLTAGSGLEHVYRSAPAVHDGALPVQLSVPPLFIRGQNVGRIPAYLPGMLALGEHPGSGSRPLGPQLRQPPGTDPVALAALGMLDIARQAGFAAGEARAVADAAAAASGPAVPFPDRHRTGDRPGRARPDDAPGALFRFGYLVGCHP
jgi:hypothetical protein